MIQTDPIKRLTNDLKTLLTRWKNNEIIDVGTYRKLMNHDGTTPRAYRLSKTWYGIHKTGHPLRIIVSSINSLLYNLAYYLHSIIKKNIPAATSYIANSHHLVDQLNGTWIDPSQKLASLDVVSLFTNVPTDLAIKSISEKGI